MATPRTDFKGSTIRQKTSLRLPENGFSHPFQEIESAGFFGDADKFEGREHPRTVVELRMCTLSSQIREQPDWWEKLKDRRIVKGWRETAWLLAGRIGGRPEWSLTSTMINYVLEELQGFADLRDPVTGIEVGPAERIWQSDKLIPSHLREKLLAAVKPLENVPDSEKDWHPESDGFVRILVHPNLYPIVYGRTIGKSLGSATATTMTVPEFGPTEPRVRPAEPRSGSGDYAGGYLYAPGYEPTWTHGAVYGAGPAGGVAGSSRSGVGSRGSKFVSKRFQWLPSDFFVDNDGKVTLTSPYINNIHPSWHKELNSVIQKILQCAVPMFERVLSDLIRPLLPMRVTSSTQGPSDVEMLPGCIWSHDVPLSERGSFDRQDYEVPEAKRCYGGDLRVMKDRISLKGRTLQVFVKLANIILTPERAKYPGGGWHVEGMRNEKIVASFIYYYDSKNISESKLSFRRATSEPQPHFRGDEECMKVLYGIDAEEPLVQDVGGATTKTHRCVAFPNLYQHQVQPFHLEDRTKPGHRKILVFFLVDPTQRIPSTTDVAPQQREWITDVMKTAGKDSMFSKLPAELLGMISEENDGTMSRSEAEEYREELVRERIVSVETTTRDYFGVVRRRAPISLRGD